MRNGYFLCYVTKIRDDWGLRDTFSSTLAERAISRQQPSYLVPFDPYLQTRLNEQPPHQSK